MDPLEQFRGNCPSPFLQEETFPTTGGYIPGRLCMPLDFANATCCIPCPVAAFVYQDGFQQRTEIGSWVNLAAVFATAFLLLSFIVLPVKWTHRHYLSICLTLGVLCMEIAFIIPLAVEPDQCYNAITPNDFKTDIACAFSGAFLLFGGWAAVVWVFWRALSLHVQICWAVVPGPKFFYSALAFGWGIPSAALATSLSLTGVSYRFGSVCHINHQYGLQDFWGPLLAFAAMALVLQCITVGYCIQVYVRSLMKGQSGTSQGTDLPSYNGSMAGSTARQTYRRIKKVIQLQWRGATIVLFIIGEVIFFSVVFVSMDNSTQVNEATISKALPWAVCLIVNNGEKDKCLKEASALIKDEGTVLAVLICLGLSGFWCLLFLGRWSMVLGWIDFFKRPMFKKREFVSADARRLSNDPRTYEMLGSKNQATAFQLQYPTETRSPSTLGTRSPMSPEPENEYYHNRMDSRNYRNTEKNYSGPRSPRNETHGYGWDPRSTQAAPMSTYLPGTAISKDYSD